MSHIDHSAEYWYFYLSEIDMCHLGLERASLLVIRYANHLHAIGITRGLRHYQGHHMRLFENQKNTALFLLLVIYVRGEIETILEQYLLHHNNPTYIIIFHGLLCKCFCKI